jgi:hypothetical protein
MGHLIDEEEQEIQHEKIKHQCKQETYILGASVIALFLLLISIIFLLSGCTISMQNISTHGTSSDLVDEDQATTPTISPDTRFSVPFKPI